LVRNQIDAGSRLLHEFERYAPVKFAAWLRETESGRWYLYVSSDKIDDRQVDLAYGEVLRIVSNMSDPRLDPFRVRIVAANTTTAQELVEVQRRCETRTTPPPTHVSTHLGIDDAYVYSLPAGTASP
jgi:hypothetical protein